MSAQNNGFHDLGVAMWRVMEPVMVKTVEKATVSAITTQLTTHINNTVENIAHPSIVKVLDEVLNGKVGKAVEVAIAKERERNLSDSE